MERRTKIALGAAAVAGTVVVIRTSRKPRSTACTLCDHLKEEHAADGSCWHNANSDGAPIDDREGVCPCPAYVLGPRWRVKRAR